MSMNAQEQVARRRLSVLQLADALNSVSEACRRRGMTRTQFYAYPRRFELQGLEGLEGLPPIHKTHPRTTAPEAAERVLALRLAHPARGCARLAARLKLDGVSTSGPTIQNRLIKHGMASKFDRLLQLEEPVAGEPIELTAEQVTAIEKADPCFRERHVAPSRPGELLCQDTFLVGVFEGIGTVYLRTVVDTHGSYAFAFLRASEVPEAAVAVPHDDALPFYAERGIAVDKLLTDNGRGVRGTQAHPDEPHLALADLAHKRTEVRSPQADGVVERFHRTVKEEFFEPARRATFYAAVDALQADLDRRLARYNTERPHLGCRTPGKRPSDTINAYLNVRHAG